MGSRRLAQLADLADGTEARTLVRTLNRRYDGEGWAFRVVEVAGGFQLLTRAKFAPWLRRLHAARTEIRLSAPAMETLAVVAYRQPVLRAEIETVRGVQCGEILRQLMERDLVRIAGRSEELGRPFLYGTTKLFLKAFGLRHLEELPQREALGSASARGDRRRTDPPDSPDGCSPHGNQTIHFNRTEGVNVRIADDTMVALEEETAATPAWVDLEGRQLAVRASDDDDFEDEDEDFEDEDDDDLDDDDEEDLDDEDLDDEDFEDDEWEEVDDEDLDEEEEDLDDDEEWDDEEDEEWDDDEDEDWDDEEEEEEEGDWE